MPLRLDDKAGSSAFRTAKLDVFHTPCRANALRRWRVMVNTRRLKLDTVKMTWAMIHFHLMTIMVLSSWTVPSWLKLF